MEVKISGGGPSIWTRIVSSTRAVYGNEIITEDTAADNASDSEIQTIVRTNLVVEGGEDPDGNAELIESDLVLENHAAYPQTEFHENDRTRVNDIIQFPYSAIV